MSCAYRISVALFVLFSFGYENHCSAADSLAEALSKRVSEINASNVTSDPLCGIYAVHRALQIEGVEIDLAKFVTDEFVSTKSGSSPADLVRMIESGGSHAEPRAGLSIFDLWAWGGPFVANVRSDSNSKSFGHWVCVEIDGHAVVVYDGAAPGVVVPLADFLAMWNGYGILVGNDTNRIHLVSLFGVLRVTCIMAVMFALVLCLKLLHGARCVLFFSLSVLALGSVSLALSAGTIDIRQSLRLVGNPYKPPPYEMVEVEDLRDVSGQSDVIVLDARLEADYVAGTMFEAVNVPFYLTDAQLEAAFSKIPDDTKLYVFCQSRKCTYSHDLARKLHAIGFTSIYVLRTGYGEYSREQSA